MLHSIGIVGGGLREKPELVTNGSFDSPAGWGFTVNAQWSSAFGGSVRTTDGGTGNVTQAIAFENGVDYVVTFDVKAHSGSGSRVLINNVVGTVRSAIGTYTEVIKAGAASSGLVIQPRGSIIDNISIKKA